MRPSATIVIPCRNSASTLGATLRGVQAQHGRDELLVIVSDNGSTDGSREIADELADVVVTAKRPGVAHARNAGLQRVKTPLLLSLDADCVPQPDWASRHLETMREASTETVGSAGRTIPELPGDRWQVRADLTPHPAFDAHGKPLYAVAGNACYRTDALNRLGGFPPYGADDAALGVVARKAGFDFRWCPDAVVTHRNPRGWSGYAAQMVKVGAYAAEIDGMPANRPRWYLRQAARLVRSPLLPGGGTHEVLAQATKIVGMSIGARRVWRQPGAPRSAAEYAAARVPDRPRQPPQPTETAE
jgi:glycosyltransferase involved in cell wall biosynthesis